MSSAAAVTSAGHGDGGPPRRAGPGQAASLLIWADAMCVRLTAARWTETPLAAARAWN